MTVRAIVEEFLHWCELHRSTSTVPIYRSRLNQFVERFGSRAFDTLRLTDIEQWLADSGRRSDGSLKRPDTRRGYVITFQRLQTWAIEHGKLQSKIAERLEKPPSQERRRLPTDAEAAAIIENASPAFRLIYVALRQSGARPGELAAAQLSDIEWRTDRDGRRIPVAIELVEHKAARVTGRSRRIIIGEQFAGTVTDAIGDRTAGPVFLSPRGRQWTQQGLSRTFERLRKRLDLPKDLVLYLTRHWHATKLCRLRGIQAAAESLGHTNLNTTRRYVVTEDDELRDNQDLVE